MGNKVREPLHPHRHMSRLRVTLNRCRFQVARLTSQMPSKLSDLPARAEVKATASRYTATGRGFGISLFAA